MPPPTVFMKPKPGRGNKVAPKAKKDRPTNRQRSQEVRRQSAGHEQISKYDQNQARVNPAGTMLDLGDYAMLNGAAVEDSRDVEASHNSVTSNPALSDPLLAPTPSILTSVAVHEDGDVHGKKSVKSEEMNPSESGGPPEKDLDSKPTVRLGVKKQWHETRWKRIQKWTKLNLYLSPQKPWVQKWDAISVVLLFYTATVTPFEVSLFSTSEVDWLFFLNRIVDLGFFLDLIFGFFVAYQDKKTGLWVYEQPRIARHYFTGWFWIDAISMLPFDLVGLIQGLDHLWKLKLVRFVRLMRLAKLLRVFKAGRVLSRLEATIPIDYNMLQLLKYVIGAFISAHWMACGWCFMLQLDEENNWALVYFGENALNLEKSRLYLGGLYWSAMTMSTIGYGDIIPSNSVEMAFATFSMVCGAFAYGYVIGAVSGILSTRDAKRNNFYSTMGELNNFMADVRLPQPVRTRLREYFKYRCMSSVDVNAYRSLLHIMSPKLRDEIALLTNSNWIKHSKIFKDCPQRFITEIALAMELRTYPPAELILARGSHLTEMFIVKRGVVVAQGRVFSVGKVFGEETVLKEAVAPFSARSMTFSDISTLDRTMLWDIIEGFPDLKRRIHIESIRHVFMQEVLAYTKAYKNIMCEMQGLIAVGEGLLTVDDIEHELPAPELNGNAINSRVLHYSVRLRRMMRAVMRDDERKALARQRSLQHLRENAMAVRLQKVWLAHVRKKRDNKVSTKPQLIPVLEDACEARSDSSARVETTISTSVSRSSGQKSSSSSEVVSTTTTEKKKSASSPGVSMLGPPNPAATFLGHNQLQSAGGPLNIASFSVRASASDARRPPQNRLRPVGGQSLPRSDSGPQGITRGKIPSTPEIRNLRATCAVPSPGSLARNIKLESSDDSPQTQKLEDVLGSIQQQLVALSMKMDALVDAQYLPESDEPVCRLVNEEHIAEDIQIRELQAKNMRYQMSMGQSSSQVSMRVAAPTKESFGTCTRNDQSLLLDMFTRPDTTENRSSVQEMD